MNLKMADSTLAGSTRVNLEVLDRLMNLAGELVLNRNQLIQSVGAANTQGTALASQRIDLITSDLQETVMKTRMQPVQTIFERFKRRIRDWSGQLGKEIELAILGNGVELDKTILEAMEEILVDLVGLAVTYSLETGDDRVRVGKPRTGVLKLEATQDAGQVTLSVSDDGQGLAPASKEEVRQYGSKISALGGDLEIGADPAREIRFLVRLPLTLAIIPSQVTAVGQERYALPQANLDELIRIPASQVKDRIEKVGEAPVVRLRGALLPLMDLSGILGLEKKYTDQDGTVRSDRRVNMADRRSLQHCSHVSQPLPQPTENPKALHPRHTKDRRQSRDSALHIAVVSSGTIRYGLVVDHFLEAEEIVVKPLGRHLRECLAYAGATIMGDGKVALILDISNLARLAGIPKESMTPTRWEDPREHQVSDAISLITFKNTETEYFCALLEQVVRIERFSWDSIERVGTQKVVQHRGGSLALFTLSDLTDALPLPEKPFCEVIVFRYGKREAGLMVSPPLDTLEISLNVDDATLKGSGILGSAIIRDHTTRILDVEELVRQSNHTH